MTDLARNTIQPFNYFHLLDTQKLDCKRKILSLEKDTAIKRNLFSYLHTSYGQITFSYLSIAI